MHRSLLCQHWLRGTKCPHSTPASADKEGFPDEHFLYTNCIVVWNGTPSMRSQHTTALTQGPDLSSGTSGLLKKLASPEDMCLLCRHMKREGTITFNGSPSTKRLKRIIGFVMQVRYAAINLPAASPMPSCRISQDLMHYP